ncbi:hypothetical protein [Succinimonas sp.]|uniref:hypothetical protein n=1 Tax=Succinimonas sp. TaxID=1936151 RepID=UPI0038682755
MELQVSIYIYKRLNVPRGTTEIMADKFHGNYKSMFRNRLNVPRGTTLIMADEFHRNFQVSIQEKIECSRGTTEIMTGKFHGTPSQHPGKD